MLKENFVAALHQKYEIINQKLVKSFLNITYIK